MTGTKSKREEAKDAAFLASVLAAEPKATRFLLKAPRCTGVFVRVSPAGSKVWTVMARTPAGKQVWEVIASFDPAGGVEAIDTTREAAKLALARIRQGEAKGATPAAGKTVAAAIDDYLRHVALERRRTIAEIRRRLDRHVRRAWGERKLASITEDDVKALCRHVRETTGREIAKDVDGNVIAGVDGKPARQGRATADKVYGDIRALLNYAAPKGSPAKTAIKDCGKFRRDELVILNAKGRKKRRNVVLSIPQLQALWPVWSKRGKFGALARALLLTAQRYSIVAGMKRSDLGNAARASALHLDVSAADLPRLWTPPADVWSTKDNIVAVLLPPAVLDIIAEQPTDPAQPDYVFPGNGKAGWYTDYFRPKTYADKLAGVPPKSYRLHDLRGTAASMLKRHCGAEPWLAELVLGHAEDDIPAHYGDSPADFLTVRSDALAALAAKVEAIVHPSPTRPSAIVTPIRLAAAS